jgi:hypothetical protein
VTQQPIPPVVYVGETSHEVGRYAIFVLDAEVAARPDIWGPAWHTTVAEAGLVALEQPRIEEVTDGHLFERNQRQWVVTGRTLDLPDNGHGPCSDCNGAPGRVRRLLNRWMNR